MFKLAIFCSALILVSAKLRINQVHSQYLDDENLEIESSEVDLKLNDVLSDDLWVLEIDDFLLSSVTLWAGSIEEDREFEDAFGPLIARYETRQNRKERNTRIPQQPESEDADDDEVTVKGEIMRILNKFALSAMTDPDESLFETENIDESPSLTLFFKGPYSSLSVISGSRNWRYFISPPSPLPRWFYEKHQNSKRTGQAMYVEAPKHVEKEFYKSLWNLLHRFLSVPV